MANTEVETIGVRLTLDAAGFAGGAEKATASMNAFTAAAERASTGAAGMKALGGAQVAGRGGVVAGTGPSSAQMAAVNVPLTVNAATLAELRTQIIKGLGSIPISITPQVAKTIATEAKSVVSAVSTPAIGTRSGAARAVETAVRNNLPTRAHGGPVQQGRDVLVGERGPEIYRPRASGTIHPDAERFYREQARLRKREAELAALEYQQEQRHAHAMGGRRVARLAPPTVYPHTTTAAEERRAATRNMLHGHGNIRGWQNEMWRQQEAAERADEARWADDWAQALREYRPRAQGGPAHKGGLPRGYKIDILSRRSGDYDIGSTPSNANLSPDNYAAHGYVQIGKGQRVSSRNPKEYQKPLIYSPDVAAGVLAVVRKGDKTVATFPFDYSASKEQWGVPTPQGSYHPNYSITDVEHRRKGLATAAYMKVERLMGRPIAPSHVQLSRGKAFWAQPDRPFGVRFGSRPMDTWEADAAARDTYEDAQRLQYEREARARRLAAGPPSQPGPTTFDPVQRARAQARRLVCPTCGTGAGPFTSQASLDFHMEAGHGITPSPSGSGVDHDLVAAVLGTPYRAPAHPPIFGQPLPTRTRTRRQRQNDPQEQMRRISYGESGPWTATSTEASLHVPRPHVPQPAPVFGEGQFLPTTNFQTRYRALGGPASGGRTVYSSEGDLQRMTFLVNGEPTTFFGSTAEIMDQVRGLGDADIKPWRPQREQFGPRGHGPSTARVFVTRAKRGGGGLVHAKMGLFPAVKSDAFFAAIKDASEVVRPSGRKVGETVHVYNPEEYADMRTYLTRDQKAGYAIKPDGDLVSVFNVGGKGMGKAAIRSAIQRGALKLDAFDEVGANLAIGNVHPRDFQKNLPNFYRKFGFREVGRDPWNPDYAPEGWVGGTPDVVYMERMKARHRQGGGMAHAVGEYRRFSDMAAANPLSRFGGNMWYKGRRRAMLEEASQQGWLDRSSFGAFRRSAEKVIATPSLASPGLDDRFAIRWSHAILDAIHKNGPAPAGGEEAWVRNLQKTTPGLMVGYGYGNFAKAASAASGHLWPPTFGVSPKVEPFYHAVRGREHELVADVHHLMAGGFDPNGPASKVNKIVRNKLVVGSKPTAEREIMLEASKQVHGEYAAIWPTISRWQAAIWGEHLPFGGRSQPIENAYSNLIVPKGMRQQLPPNWKLGPKGLLVPRAGGGTALASDQSHGLVHPGGGFLSDIAQTAADWANDPFMAIMAWQQQQGAHKARGGYVPNRDWERRRERIKAYKSGLLSPRLMERVGKPRLNEDFAGAPLPFTAGTLVGDRRWNNTMGRVDDPRRWIAGMFGSIAGVPGVFPKKNAEGGPVMGPLQRRLLGLEEPPKVEIPKPVEPFEPEWLKRARTSKLPPKVFREGGGDVMAKLRSQSVEAERPWKNAGRAARLNALIAEQQGVVRLFTVRDQLGLHMRPSAHLARMAADFDANVIVENLTRGMPQKGQINAKYMPHLLALGARQGDQLRLRGTGTDAEAAVRALGGLIEHPGLTRIAQTNASLEKADPAMIRAAELFAKFTGRAGGGPVMSPWVRRALENNLPAKELSSGGKGLYIVGEVGKELFVPDRMRDLIPKKVMDQIPKAASGMQVIGQKPNSLFAPPEDGIIIPNRLMDQVPHRQDGGETLEAAFQQSKVDPYRKIREKAAAEFAARQGAAYMPQNMFAIPRTPPPGPSYTPSTATIASLGLTKPGAGVSTGPILTPAAEAASKMAAPFTGAAAAADKLRAAFEGFTPVVGSKKVASRGVATGGGGASASDEALFNGPAQYGNPEWRAARDRVLAQRAASRSPIERVSPRHRPQSQSTAPSRPAGMSNEEFLRTLDPEAQAFMGVSGGPRIPRGMQGASSRMGAPGRGGRTPEEREALARYRGTMADTMRESGAWQQVMGGRTPRGDIAQLSSMLFGGRGPMYALQNQARGQKRQLDTMTTAHPEALTGPMGLDAYVEKTAQLMGARGDERREIEKSLLAMRAQKNATGEVIEKFDELRATTLKLQPSTGSIVRNLGTIIGATTLYGFAMTMANKGMEVAGDVISKQVDALTNWKSTSTKVTSALAEQTMAASGNVTATISQAAATAGLSSGALDFVKAALQTTILVKAGALAEDKTQELMRASFGQQGAPAGLYGGTGGVLGSSLLASYMGGTKGFSENVQGLFAGNRPGAPDVAGNLSMGLQYFTNGDTRNLVNTEAKKQGNPLGVVGEIPGGVVDALRGFGPITGPVMDTLFPKTPSSNPNEGGVYNPLVGLDQNAINANAAGLEDLNSAAGRGASLTKNSASVHWRYAQNMAEEDAAVVTAIRAGDTYGATMARTSHIVMAVGEGIGKLAESSEQYKQAMTQSAMGKTIISPDVWAGLAQRQIEAQLQMNSLQAKRQQQLTIPWSVTMQLLQQPLITPGLAAFPGAAAGAPSGVAAGMSKGAASTAEGFLSDARKAQADVKAIAKQGYEAQLGNMRQQFPGGSSGGGNWATGVRFPTQQNDSTEVARFKELYATSQEASLSIQHTTEALAGIQLEADKQSWGNSIRLATRSLGDALGMAGKTGSVAATALGKMERASHFLEVQGTQLGLQLQQRSITTALAQAQFQAPGQTGEERFFAQKEAIAKAGIQQEQLNISTKEFNLSKQIWVENANRAATDAQRAIEVMVSSRDAEKATVAAQASIAASEQKLGVAVAGMQSLVGQADANWSTMTGAALSGISQFSGALDDGVTAIYKALGYSVSSKNGINTFTAGSGPSQYGPSTVTTTSPAQGGGRNDGGRATGMLGSFSTPTNVTFGEAGTETVAILRNPRAGSLGAEGGGGASGPVTVNINGPVVRNEQDIAELARCVAIEVEKSLARKGQMFGLRGAAV